MSPKCSCGGPSPLLLGRGQLWWEGISNENRKVIQVANGTYLGIESKLWAAADALRNNMDAAEYKHVVLGLIFLKYISDAFEARHADLETQRRQGADAEDP